MMAGQRRGWWAAWLGVLALLDGRAYADALTGDVGAALSTPEAAGINPANAGFVDRTQVSFQPELLKQGSLQVHYPGFAPITSDDSGMGNMLSFKPAMIFKVTPTVGIGGYAVPPIDMTVTIKKPNIPIVMLGQQYFVDLNATGQLAGVAAATVGIRVSDHFGLGLGGEFMAIKLSSKLTVAGETSPLATITGTQTNAIVRAGMRIDLKPGRIAFGIAVDVVRMQNNDLKIDSPLLSGLTGAGGGGGGGGGPMDGASSKSTVPFGGAVVGGQIGGKRLHLLGDLVFTRADTTLEGYSLISLKKEKQDLHDTVAAHGGLIIEMLANAHLLAGVRYEPAALGPGQRAAADGSAGMIGFGTMNLAMIYAGIGSLTPYWQVASGLQLGMLPKTPPHGGRSYYSLTMEGGGGYQRASLGIDSKGELPGAYLYSKTFVAGGMTLKI